MFPEISRPLRGHLHSFLKLEFDKILLHLQKYAVSSFARESIASLAPSSSIEEIRSNLAHLTEMKRLLEAEDPLPLDQLPDVRTSLHRSSIENFVLSGIELSKIALFLESSRKISGYFSNRGEKYPLLAQAVHRVFSDRVLEFNISRAIDEDGAVKDGATRELESIRRQIIEKSAYLQKRLESMLREIAGKDWAQEEIITTREGRMVIPVKSEYKGRVPGFIHSSSASGATVFIEPTETLDLNNDIRTLQFQEQREIEKILRELSGQVASVRVDLLGNVEALGWLDFVASKARYSIEIMGTEPIITVASRLKLIDARHPLLLQKHERSEVVPLSLELGDQVKTIVISGPNAGGKSVAMKTVGINVLLAQAGCHIPASSGSEIPVFEELFVDIGDEQSIENDLSSFSSHLENMKEMLEHVTPASLVLIDEIASGTDPTEGSSLASAILEHLTQLGCLTIVTTHHGSLKSFASNTPGVENAAMEFDHETLRPTYRFKLGIPGSSYALEMAERLSLQRSIVARAKELRGGDVFNIDKLVLGLQQREQELKTTLEASALESARLSGLKKSYEEKLSALKQEVREIKQQAVREAKEIVAKANTAIERTVKDIREKSADKQVIRAAKEEIRSIVREVNMAGDELAESGEPLIYDYAVGQSVKLRQGSATGEILDRIDKEHYLVLAGGIKMKVRRVELMPAGKPAAARPAMRPLPENTGPRREIDLRGMYGDEAVTAIEKLFDEAVLAGLHRVDIIHGKGTGALRKRVTGFLKNHPSVKSFRLGEWNEGGSGVTVVELH